MNFITMPLRNEANRNLSGHNIWYFRLDYLLHLAMILIFAWIWVLGKLRNANWFPNLEMLYYCQVIMGASIFLDLFQIALPGRALIRWPVCQSDGCHPFCNLNNSQ